MKRQSLSYAETLYQGAEAGNLNVCRDDKTFHRLLSHNHFYCHPGTVAPWNSFDLGLW